MLKTNPRLFILTILLSLFIFAGLPAAEIFGEESTASETQNAPISLPENLQDAMFQEANRLTQEFEQQARSLFERSPLGWNWHTVDFLYRWALTLPLKIPTFMRHVMEQSRVLGVVGSLIVLIFIVAVLYSLIGQKRVLARLEKGAEPLLKQIPDAIYPYIFSTLRVVVASLIPLILLGLFTLINGFIEYKATWFQLTGRLLGLWAVGALVIKLLDEFLTRDLFPATAQYGKRLFKLSRLASLYILGGLALLWGAEAFQLPQDVLAFLWFVIALSIVCVLFLLFLKKKAVLSLLPDLPYPSYQAFRRLLTRYYYPLIFFSFITGILWCLGYKQFGRIFLTRTWSMGGVYVLIMLAYNLLQGWLQKWWTTKDTTREEVQILYRSIKALLLYATVTATLLIILNLLGLLNPLQRVMSFPVIKIGETPLSLWILLKAGLILLAFVYVSKLLQAYLDYKIYPSLGIDPGLAYALNTFLKYLTLIIGVLFSLRVVGLDLRVLMVFAGAIGIGIGFGLQNMAANVISGFSIIFGGKLRKGDWIEVGDTSGVVTDIYLRATRVRTRDNIEYLVPNADFISSTVVNYTLSSPMIRIRIPVGVSYDADPLEVEKILLASAEKHPEVNHYKPPEVRFDEFGDNSINFELLIWIDIRNIAKRLIRSRLYFTIFKALKEAGIEIPFPQRDLHLRSGFERLNGIRPNAQNQTSPESLNPASVQNNKQ